MNAEQNFWRWFAQNQAQIFDFEQNQEEVFDSLQEQLQKVHENLVFEISRVFEGKREFVISADGIREAFPAVESLYACAPDLPNWEIIKFRPRIAPNFSISFGEKEMTVDDIMFSLEPDDGKIGISLYLKDYKASEHEQFAGIAYLFLDGALGEYDVETKVGFIEILPLWTESNLPKRPFKELPEIFDKKYKSLLN